MSLPPPQGLQDFPALVPSPKPKRRLRLRGKVPSFAPETAEHLPYFQHQTAAMCGLHALNHVAGSPVFTIMDLHAAVDAVVAEAQAAALTHNATCEDSWENHMNARGDFSEQALAEALNKHGAWFFDQIPLAWQVRGLETLWDADVLGALVHVPGHWVALRRYDDKIWLLDSLCQGPACLGARGALPLQEVLRAHDRIYLIRVRAGEEESATRVSGAHAEGREAHAETRSPANSARMPTEGPDLPPAAADLHAQVSSGAEAGTSVAQEEPPESTAGEEDVGTALATAQSPTCRTRAAPPTAGKTRTAQGPEASSGHSAATLVDPCPAVTGQADAEDESSPPHSGRGEAHGASRVVMSSTATPPAAAAVGSRPRRKTRSAGTATTTPPDFTCPSSARADPQTETSAAPTAAAAVGEEVRTQPKAADADPAAAEAAAVPPAFMPDDQGAERLRADVGKLLATYKSGQDCRKALAELPTFLRDSTLETLTQEFDIALRMLGGECVTSAAALQVRPCLADCMVYPLCVLMEATAKAAGLPAVFFVDVFHTLLNSIFHKELHVKLGRWESKNRHWWVGTANVGEGKSPAMKAFTNAVVEVLGDISEKAVGRQADRFHYQQGSTTAAAIDKIRDCQGYLTLYCPDATRCLCPAAANGSHTDPYRYVDLEIFLDAAHGDEDDYSTKADRQQMKSQRLQNPLAPRDVEAGFCLGPTNVHIMLL